MTAAITTNQWPTLLVRGRDRPRTIQSMSSYQNASQKRKTRISVKFLGSQREMLFSDHLLYLDPSTFSKSVKYVSEYLTKEATYQNHTTSDSGITWASMEKLVKSPRELPYILKWTQGHHCPHYWWEEEMMLRNVCLLRAP